MTNKLPSWFTEAVVTGKVKGEVKSPEWFKTHLANKSGYEGTEGVEISTAASDYAFPVNKHIGGKPSKIVSYSYWNVPIVDRPDKGNSRRWGDASDEVKARVKSAIMEEARGKGLGKKDTAYILAIADHESGFNPDAAPGSTSAHGVGQFINKTGAGYGLTDETRWNTQAQVSALVAHYIDNKKRTETNGRGIEYIYAYHHDGPSLAYGGIKTSRKSVMPKYKKYLKALGGSEVEEGDKDKEEKKEGKDE